MEAFQEVKDRRDKPQQPTKGPRRGGNNRGNKQGGQGYRPKTAAPKDGDVVMKDEEKPQQ